MEHENLLTNLVDAQRKVHALYGLAILFFSLFFFLNLTFLNYHSSCKINDTFIRRLQS